MESKAKVGSVVSTVQDQEAGTITFRVVGCPDLVLDLTKVNPDVVTTAAYHGFVQRIGDAAALSRDPVTGKPAPAEEKHAAIKELVDHYMSGTDVWRVGRAAGGGAGKEGGVTLRAVAEIQGVELSVMRTRVDALAEKRGLKPAALLRELAKSPAVIKRIAEIRAAASKVSSDDLMGELSGE